MASNENLTHDELLRTAEKLLESGSADMYRACVLEAVTALESVVHQVVFGLLARDFDPLFVKWLKDKTKYDFDSRLSPLAYVATGTAVRRDSQLWNDYKKVRDLRNRVTHSGLRVSKKQARFVLETVYQWIEYLDQATQRAKLHGESALVGEFFELWARLERCLYGRVLRAQVEPKPTRDRMLLINRLVQQSLISSSVAHEMQYFRSLRNQLVHGIEVEVQADWIQRLRQVVSELEALE